MMKYMSVDAHDAIMAIKDREIARITALVAMQSDYVVHKPHCHFGAIKDCTCGLDKVLAATTETVSAYQNEVKAKVWDESSGVWNLCACCWTQEQQDAIEEVSLECTKKAAELRAKGE